MSIYRRIYEHHHGPIPKDENGRSFDIHHIDGNRKNNDLSNLIAVSIQEHYDIHYKQGDWNACVRIISRTNTSPELLSELARRGARKRLESKNHHFLDSAWQKQMVMRSIEKGTNKLVGGDLQRETHKRRLEEGTHHLLGPNTNRKMLSEGKHPSQIKIKCPHCGKVGGSNIMRRWHFDNCSQKQQNNK